MALTLTKIERFLDNGKGKSRRWLKKQRSRKIRRTPIDKHPFMGYKDYEY